MALFVITVFGDDRPGIVSALSGPITRHQGNWERSQLVRLAGKFAGIVEASVPDERYAALVAELTALEDLHVTIEGEEPAESGAVEGEGFRPRAPRQRPRRHRRRGLHRPGRARREHRGAAHRGARGADGGRQPVRGPSRPRRPAVRDRRAPGRPRGAGRRADGRPDTDRSLTSERGSVRAMLFRGGPRGVAIPARTDAVTRPRCLRSADTEAGVAGVGPVGRPRAHHPRAAGPRGRGGRHRDRGASSGCTSRRRSGCWPPSRRTASSSRSTSGVATGSASATCGWPARRPRGSTWSPRRGRSAGSWRPTPARPSTSPCAPRPARSTSTRSPGSSALQSHNWVGQHIPLHATSNGKVLLSELTEAELQGGAAASCPGSPTRPSPSGPELEDAARARPRGRVRRRGRRARGRTDRGRRADPQRPRRHHRLDEHLRTDVPARPDERLERDRARCSSAAATEVSHRLGWGQRT